MKIISLIVIVIGLVLSVTSAPVLADANPEGLLADQPVEEGGITSDAFIPEGEIGVDFEFEPLSPTEGQITHSLTPKYYFSRYPGVTQYKLEVQNFDEVVFTYPFTFPGAATCGTAYCWVQPPNKLSPYKYKSIMGGYYHWRVAAKVGTTWVWSPAAAFWVLSKGFTSTFDSNTKNWTALNGTWTRVDPGYYKTTGTLGETVYALNQLYFMDNSVYEIRMKRKGEIGSMNRIYFVGDPGNLTDGHWEYGYVLQYWNTDGWNLYAISGYHPTQLYTGTSVYLEPEGWNTFTIWRDFPYIYIWINGIFIGRYEDSSNTGGYFGIGMFENVAGASPLLVDYVKAYYSGTAPENIPLTADGEPDPAYLLNP